MAEEVNFLVRDDDDDDGVSTEDWINATTNATTTPETYLPYLYCPTYERSDPKGIDFIFVGPVSLTIGAFGILVNLMTLIVLGKQHQFKATPKIIMMTLAISDIVEIINQWLFWGAIRFFGRRTNPVINFFFLNHNYIHPIYRTLVTFNRGLTLLMTIDRWFIVCRTLLANRWWTTRKVTGIIAGLAFYSIIINIPNVFEYKQKVKPCIDRFTMQNSTYSLLLSHGSLLGCNDYFIWIYVTVFHTGVITILPCILMIVFNALTIRNLVRNMEHRIGEKRQGLRRIGGSGRCGGSDRNGESGKRNGAEKKANGGGRTLLRTHSQTPDVNRSITIMCIAVTIVFVILQTPYTVHNIGNTIYYRLPSCRDIECKERERCEEIDRVSNMTERRKCFESCMTKQKTSFENHYFKAIVSTCLMLNSSVNGLIYFCAGSSFRQKFFDIFMPWRHRFGRRASAGIDLSNSASSTRVRTFSASKTDSLKAFAAKPFLLSSPAPSHPHHNSIPCSFPNPLPPSLAPASSEPPIPLKTLNQLPSNDEEIPHDVHPDVFRDVSL